MRKSLMAATLVVVCALAATATAERGDSYVLLVGDNLSMSGNFAWDSIRELRDEIDEPFLWVRKDGREWVIRDLGTVQRAQSLFEPLDRFMEVEFHDLEAEEQRLDEIDQQLEEEEDRLDDLAEEIEDEVEEGDRWTDDLRAREHEIERRMRDLEGRQRDLEREFRELETKERELERREEELEIQIERKLWNLIDESIRDGPAVPRK